MIFRCLHLAASEREGREPAFIVTRATQVLLRGDSVKNKIVPQIITRLLGYFGQFSPTFHKSNDLYDNEIIIIKYFDLLYNLASVSIYEIN